MSYASSLGRFVSRPNRSSGIRSKKESRRGATRGLFSQDNVARFMRLAVEPLEERRVLSGDQWVIVFRGLTLGATPEEQVQAGQAFLQDHGVNDIQIVAALDLEGTFLAEATEDASDESLGEELQPLPGFAIAEEYEPQAAPSGTFDSGPFEFLPGSSDPDVAPPASWSTATTAPASVGTMMLLSDGTVMAQGSGVSNTWFKLTPNAAGSYLNGTWSQLASMGTQRLYYGSNVLPSGKVFLVGGEYSGSSGAQNFINTGEIYDPVANTWSPIANFPQSAFGDDPTELLPDGRVLAGYISGAQTYIYNPTTNLWSQTGTKLRSDRSDEETWILLPDGSILSYDIFSSISLGVGHAQRYVPSTGTWIDAGTVPVPLSSSALGFELGPALLLPDGRVFLVGANNNTALYTPSTNTWTAGPTLPAGLGADDTPGAVLPNGHVIFAADTSQPLFTGPTRLFDFDPGTNTIIEVTGLPSQLTTDLNHAAFTTRMLVLPSGQLMLNPGGSSRLWVYTPDGTPNAAWRPTISSVVNNGNGTYTLTGTQLNGISEGASYGDDAEMSSNYPIVQLTSTSTGNVYYARTSNWSSTGVATGSTPVSTQFVLPAGVPAGNFSLSVIANGIASSAVSFTTGLYWDPDGNPANNNIATGAGLGGTGNWNTSSAVWFNGVTDVAWNNANNDAAIFTGAAGTVTLTTGITVRAVEFSTTGYTVQSNTLTLGGSIAVDPGLTDTISATIAGTAGLTLTGGGTAILTGANTYTGTTTVSTSTLQVGNGGTSGNLSTGTITDNGALVFNRSDSVTIGSTISGTGTLTQAGTGTLIFTANNTFTGITTINAGTLQLGNNGLTGSVASASIINNSALVINRSSGLTLSSLISGPGSLTKLGSSVTTLTAANTYSGPTNILGGTLQAGVTNAIPSMTAVTVPVGGNLNLNNFDDTIASIAGGGTVTSTTVSPRGSGYTSPPTVIFNNAGTGGTGAAATANLTPAVTSTAITNGGSGYTSAPTVTFSAPPSGTTATGTANVSGGVVTSITIVNGGTGYTSPPTITFTGGGGTGAAATAIVTNVVNSLTITNGGSGYTTIPTISFSGGGGTGAAATAVISVPSLVLGSGTLTVGGDNTSTNFVGVISGTGNLTKVGTGTLTLTGNSTFSGTTTISGGTLQIGNNSGIGTLGPGPIVDNSALVISRSSPYTVSGAISGSGTVTKLGTGTVTLSGINSYSGATTVNAGRLNITGSNTSSATTVNNSGTLGGNGPIDGVTVNAGGTLSPGQSPGILTTGNLNLAASSIYSVELNGNVAGTNYDQTVVNGTVNLAGTLSLSGNRTNGDGTVLTIISNDGNDPVVGTFTGLPEGASVTVNSVIYVLSYHGGDGNDVTLTDDTPPRVVATSIAPGSIVSGNITLQVTFSEPMKVSNLTSDDFALRGVYRGLNFGATSSSFNADGTILTLSYGSISDDFYVFTLFSGSANFASAAGTSLDGEFNGTFPSGDGLAGGNFVMTFIDDVASEGYTTPLEAEPPIGSLVYDPLLTRVIAYEGDTDTFTINVDSGQTMSILVSQTSGGLQPSVELRDAANNLLSSATATDPDLPVFINSIPVASGTQRITVSGVGGTTGRYNIQVILNAALETESNGGPSNDTIDDAQDLDVTATNPGFKTSRLAALGTAGGKPSFMMEDFESGALPASITTFSSDPSGRIQVAPTQGNGNTSGFALFMDRQLTGPLVFNLNEAIYTVDLSDADQATLSFSFISLGDETHTMPQSFTGHFNGDGVAISDDGISWWTVLNAPNNTNWTNTNSGIDLKAAAAAAGMTFGPNFQIRFQQYDDNQIPTDGRAYDNIQVVASASDPADFYKFTLQPSEHATLAVTGMTSGNLNLDLLDGNGNLLQSGSGGSTTLTKMISNFVDATGGTFYVRVSGDPNVPYNLIVTRNAVLESEGNDSFATAQPMDENAGALGAIYSGVVPSSLASTEGNSSSNIPFNIGSGNTMRFQQVYSRTDFSQPGDITSIRFRRNGGQPTFDVSGINIKVNLSYATSFASPSTTFANNVGADLTTVYDSDVNGLLTLSSDDGVSTPSPFDVVITFSTPFHYDPRQGDLLLDIFLRSGFTSVPFDSSTAGQETTIKRIISATNATGVTATTGTLASDTGLVTRFDMNVPKEDWYSFNIDNTANILWLSTSTPADGGNQFVNVLNPKIELYDPSGNLVATGKPNGLNNRNEFIQYQPSVTGNYRVRVTGENGTSGEYLLFKNFRPAPIVSVTSPIDENDATTLTGTINDPDVLDSHTVVINWGPSEGSSTLTIPAGINTFSASHTYLDDNPSGTSSDDYPLSVVVTDNLGGPGNAAVGDGTAIALTGLHGDVSDTDFDTAVTNTFGPINASYLSFATTGIAHSHGDPVDISVQVHNVTTGNWDEVLHQSLDDSAQLNFNGLELFFAPRLVDQIRLVATPGLNQAFHSWATHVITIGNPSPIVTVNNVAPSDVNLVLDAPIINENNSATLSGSFVDPGTLDIHTVTINWGDGSPSTVLNLDAGILDIPATAHQYLDDNPSGTSADAYAITVTVTDDDGGTGTGSTSITVQNVVPANVSVNLGANSINENGSTTLDGSFTDAGTLDAHTVVINWGPGETSTTLSLAAGVLTFSATHQYLDDNPSGTASDLYPITVTVTDDDGGTGTGNTSITVNNVAPKDVSINLSADSINENDSTTLTGSFTDPGTLDTHTVVINWGPGEGTSALSLAAGVLTFSATHQYLDDNPNGTASDQYTISVTVTDDDGGDGDAGSSDEQAGSGLMQLKLQTTDLLGNPITSIAPGGNFLLRATVRDLRPGSAAQGVFASYADVTYDPSLVSVTGPITYGPSYANGHTGDTSTPGLIDEVGAFDGISTLGASERLLYAVSFHATAAGTVQFALDPADLLPEHFTLLFGSGQPVPTDQIVFVNATLHVGDSTPLSSATATITVNNVAPSSLTLNSGSINETDSFTLNGSFLDPGTQDTHTVVITWGPGEGSTTVTLAAGVLTFSASHQYLDDNPSGTASDDYPISVTVADDDTGSASGTTQVIVHNLAPTATANSYSTSQAMAISGNVITDNTGSGPDSDPAGANDPLIISSFTQPSNGTVTIGPDGSFTYTPATTFTGTDSFTYTITDDDLGTATATVTIVVSAAPPGSILTLPDSCLGGTAVLITGTSASDTIIVEPGSSSSTLKVTFNGVSTTVPLPSGRIIVTGGAGDDNIQIAGAIANPSWLYGDAGNDQLNAGNGGSLLIGGDGDDQLQGGGGRDVMIGGKGADHLVGNSDDDILISGLTDEDSRSSPNHDEFWCELLHEWNSDDSFAQRVQTLHPVLFSVVHDDHYVDAVDFLNGASGNDWLIFTTSEDQVAGQPEATN